MLGATLHIARGHGEDRLCSPSNARRSYQQHLQHLGRSRSGSSIGYSSVPPLIFQERVVVPHCIEPEYTPELEIDPSNDESTSSFSAPSSSALVSENACSTNLFRFLESTTPSISAQFFSKKSMGECRTCDIGIRPYFSLSELWDSFKEWSAYGASVPLVLNDRVCVVQYYVPYLSGIQLYGKSSGSKDLNNDGSCKYNSGKHINSKGFIQNASKSNLNGYLLRNNDAAKLDLCPNKDNEKTGNSDCTLLFEFLEQRAPHNREPLTDKITDLSRHFPELKYLRSCELLPTSWISVAWYPIYRIPTGTTLKDQDACFLTFHSLSTQMKDDDDDDEKNFGPFINYEQWNGVPKICLPVFALASYKLRGSMWTYPSEECGSKLISSLLAAADNWLRLLRVKLPDYQFFASHGAEGIQSLLEGFCSRDFDKMLERWIPPVEVKSEIISSPP